MVWIRAAASARRSAARDGHGTGSGSGALYSTGQPQLPKSRERRQPHQCQSNRVNRVNHVSVAPPNPLPPGEREQGQTGNRVYTSGPRKTMFPVYCVKDVTGLYHLGPPPSVGEGRGEGGSSDRPKAPDTTAFPAQRNPLPAAKGKADCHPSLPFGRASGAPGRQFRYLSPQ